MTGHTSWREARALRKIAHDPGDAQITSHCPFCGSGQVVGRSDGNIECAFCGMTYLVRIQPQFTGMPGQPSPGFGGETSMAPDLMDPAMVGGDSMMDEGLPPGAGPEAEEGIPGSGEDEEDGEDGEEGSAPPWADDGAAGGDGSSDGAGSGEKPPAKKSKDKGKQKKSSLVTGEKKGSYGTLEEKAHYIAGWRASERAARSSGTGPSALERADDRGAKDAWYWGYMDHAADRPKGHSLQCRGVDHDAPGCTLWTEGSRRYRTIAGDVLPEEAYIRHLACLHGGIEAVRRAS